MKPIKIVAANYTKIADALESAAGRAHEHTLRSALDLASIADDYESRVVALVGGKTYAPGATVVWTSGEKLPNAYKYSRIVSRVVLERRPAGWYLSEITTQEAWNDAGKKYIRLTQEQDARAVSVLRGKYRIATPAGANTATAQETETATP
jgi:hypothetical protein